jgi:tripartite-type tricarboxylate transporter receptor subunit TctC
MSRDRHHLRRHVAAALAALTLSALPVSGEEADNFYAGRQVRIIVGTGTGGGYDTYARLVARHLGKYLPGNPTFIVENLPGASGIRALNYLYAAAPADGTVIATFNNAIPFYQAVAQPGIRFKSEDLSWIGSLTQTATVVAVWHGAGVKTIDDAKRIDVIMGATGSAGTKATYPALLNATLGTRFKIVTGYEGGNAVTLAIERGEVQGDGSNPWSSWKATRSEWVRDRKIVPLVQIGPKKDPDIAQVPLLGELARDDEQRQMFAFVSGPVAMQQPFAGPPRIPQERLLLLRRAFEQMTRDPAFRAEVDKLQLDLDPLPGAEIEAIARAVVQTPPAIVQKVQAAMAVKGARNLPGGAAE